MKKLNARAFSHHAVLAVILVVFAIGGAYMVIRSHAATERRFSPALMEGECLSAGQSVPGTGSRLAMQNDGNAVLSVDGTRKWSTGTTGSGNRLCLQTSGNLVVLSASSKVLWQSYTSGARLYRASAGATNYRLIFIANSATGPTEGIGVQIVPDVNNFYGPYNVIWVSYRRNALDLGFDDALSRGQYLISTDGSHKAVLQLDGNFVVYHGTTAIWSSRTSGKTGIRLLQQPGNIMLVDTSGLKVWESTLLRPYDGTKVLPRSLIMQNDGNLVMYANTGVVLWSTGTAGK